MGKKILTGIVVLAVVALCAMGAMHLLNGETEKPASVPDDSYTLRVIEVTGDEKFDMQTIDEKVFILPIEDTEIEVIDNDSGRDFLSRNQHTLYLRTDTAERLAENVEEIEAE